MHIYYAVHIYYGLICVEIHILYIQPYIYIYTYTCMHTYHANKFTKYFKNEYVDHYISC